MRKVHEVHSFIGPGLLGNPAGVLFVKEWPELEEMQEVATQLAYAETAYVLKGDDGYEIRWFTPTTEVELCGHATLAAALVVFSDAPRPLDEVVFTSRFAGTIPVRRSGDRLALDFPTATLVPSTGEGLAEALGAEPLEAFTGNSHVALFRDEQAVRALKPNFERVRELGLDGIVVTAPGRGGVDFVSRYFAPHAGIPEDPVTGYAHTLLAPFWAERLGRTSLVARQVSSRGGEMRCRIEGDRVHLSGKARRAAIKECILPSEVPIIEEVPV
ncbi:MAG: isomerase [Gemmatimonadetes bacterium]|nr:isomerase [Gemmatimonadota bacterium]